MDEKIKSCKEWQSAQSLQLQLKNLPNWAIDKVAYVGGVDISTEGEVSIAGLVVLSYPTLEIIFTDTAKCDCEFPYVPGLLGLREAPPVLQLLNRMRAKLPEVSVRNFVLMVDGNGVLHERGFGSASQIGLEGGVISIGVAKNYYHVNTLGPLTRTEINLGHGLKVKGEWKKLEPLEAAIVKSSDEASKPIFVSVGDKISLESAVEIVVKCSKFRVPEPTRHADIVTREVVRKYGQT